MNIMHLSFIDCNKASGVTVIVPQHLKWQAKFANVGLYNFTYTDIELDTNVTYLNKYSNDKFDFDKFPDAFKKPDIVIIHGVYYYQYISVMKKLNKLNIPYVIVPHGSFTEYALKIKGTTKRILNRLILDKLINNASAVQFLSEGERDMSKYNKKNIVVSNGINLPELNSKKEVTQNDIIKIIYIGRKDIFQKGLDLLLDGCESIKEYLQDNRVCIELYGPDKQGSYEKINTIIKDKKLEGIVKNFPGIFEKEKIEILNSAHAFIQTSRFEGQSVGLLESLSYGVPIIVTPGTCLDKETKEFKCGWVSDFEKEELAKTIKQAIEDIKDGKLHLYSENARKFIESKYTWDIIAKKAIKEYKNLI